MLLTALPSDLRTKPEMEPELDPRDPLTFTYGKIRMHALDNGGTADALAILDSGGVHISPGVSPYSIPAGVLLPQMPVVVNLPAIHREETPTAAQTTEEIPIANAENTIHTTMDTKVIAFEVSTVQMSKTIEPRYGGYQTAGVDTIQTDHPLPHTGNELPTSGCTHGTHLLPTRTQLRSVSMGRIRTRYLL